jgi:outer membrane protein
MSRGKSMMKGYERGRKTVALWLAICLTGCLNGQALAQEAHSAATGVQASAGTPSQPKISEGEKLSLERAVEIAQAMQPTILAAQGSIAAVQSRVGQARSGLFPQVNGSVNYDRLTPAGSYAMPIDDDHIYNQYSTGVTANQVLYDFGRIRTQVAIQKTGVESSRADLASVEDQVVFNVKSAYFDLLRAGRNREVAVETVKQFEKHLEQAKGFYEAGVKPKYDVTKAMVDLSNAKLSLIQAENGRRLARVSLNVAMGMPEAPAYEVEDTLELVRFTLPFAEALSKAYDQRPDLKSLLLKKKAAGQSVELARKGYYPSLSGSANFSDAGAKFPLDEGWDVGVGLNIPIFNGMLTRHQIGEAQANLAVIAANETGLRQSIYQQVQQSYLNLQEAEDRAHTTQLAVKEAEENDEIAVGRYDAGVGSPVEVTDADVALANAKFNHIAALYDYKIAQVTIEKAIGIMNR